MALSSTRHAPEPAFQDAACKEEYGKQEGKEVRKPLCTEQFVQSEKFVNAFGTGMNVAAFLHTVAIDDESQENMKKKRDTDIEKEDERDRLYYIDKEIESFATQLSVLDSTHQLCCPSICKYLPTCFSNLNTNIPIQEAEPNQQHTNQPKSQGQASFNATEKETMKKQNNSICEAGALEDIDIPEHIQDLNQKLSFNHTTCRTTTYAAVNCTDLQSHNLLSFSIFEGNPDVTEKNENSPETPEEPVPPARKKTRTFYSAEQLDELEKMFLEDHYPDNEKRREIAAAVGVPAHRVMVWFQNRRAKWRKMEKLIVKDNKKSSATEAALLAGSQQNYQGTASLSLPQKTENVHDQSPAFLMGPPTIICSSIHSEQSTPLVSTSVVSVTGRSTPYESVQTKDISEGILGSLKEEILPAIPSPPPIRRAILPCNVALNPNNQMTPLMASSPNSPASQENNSNGTFTCSIPSQSIISPVHCNYTEQLEPTAILETPNYHSSSHSKMFQLGQHPQHQMSQLQHFPIHLNGGMLPSVQLTQATSSKSSTPFFSIPGNGGLVTYGTAEVPPGFQQNHIGGHLLIQSSTESSGYISSFQAMPWNEFCMQRAPVTNQLCSQMTLSSSRGEYYSAEQVQFTQNQGVPPSSCPLQHPKTTVPGPTVLLTARQTAPADKNMSPVHRSQVEHMASYEEVLNTDDIPKFK